MTTPTLESYALDSYNDLLRFIRKEIEEGIARARQAVEYQGVLTNWRIGRYINEFMLPEYGPSSANAELVHRLAHDLNRPPTHIYSVAKFFRAYPDETSLNGLTWSHYKALIRIEDPAERKRYEQLALSQKISGKNLQDLIRDEKNRGRRNRLKAKAGNLSEVAQIPIMRGRLYHYKLIAQKHARDTEDRLFVDLGFHARREVQPVSGQKYRSGYVVRSLKGSGRDDFEIRMAVHPNPEELYTYIAYVERLIKADQWQVQIDCGFQGWVQQVVQLRGVSCPALTEHRGRSAKEFVNSVVKHTDRVILKTYSQDDTGVFLADVFYSPNETDPHKMAQTGRFLNQEILDKGWGDPR